MSSDLDNLFGRSTEELIKAYQLAHDAWLATDPRSEARKEALREKYKALEELEKAGIAPGQVESRTVFCLKGLEYEINNHDNGITLPGITGDGV